MTHLRKLNNMEVVVTEEEAVETVLQAIKYKESAYGKSYKELIEWLLDSIVDTDDSLIEALLLCGELRCVEETCKKLAEDFYTDNLDSY